MPHRYRKGPTCPNAVKSHALATSSKANSPPNMAAKPETNKSICHRYCHQSINQNPRTVTKPSADPTATPKSSASNSKPNNENRKVYAPTPKVKCIFYSSTTRQVTLSATSNSQMVRALHSDLITIFSRRLTTLLNSHKK